MTLPPWLPEDVWAMWVQYRKEGKHPLTLTAVTVSIKKLERLWEAGNDPRDVVLHSIECGYRGLFPPPQKREKPLPPWRSWAEQNCPAKPGENMDAWESRARAAQMRAH